MLLRRFSVPLVALALTATAVHADRPGGVCINVSAQFTPSDNLQIVAWIEKADGTYVSTIYVTSKIGRFGMGNRPGRFDFNSGSPTNDMWPYGRRITTFPVWAHRHGLSFPLVVFQDADDNNLSHPFSESSAEIAPPYCRPMMSSEPGWDAGTCASSSVFSDKGVFSPGMTSLYPPRSDVKRQVGLDSPSVDMYRALNVFDAVSQATPVAGTATSASWAAPQTVDYGNYVLWVEVSKEYDMNPGVYDPSTFPSPTGIPWSEYGQPYRGQPSVVYKAPFQIAATAQSALTLDYVGYGDPNGQDGAIRPPDSTIRTDTPGSGALRLQLVSDPGGMYRLKVTSTPDLDAIPPASPADLTATAVHGTSAQVTFTAPGDDGMVGTATGYEIRYMASTELTADNFEQGMPVTATVTPVAAGGTQAFEIDGLLPETDYWIGVRAYDNCFNQGPVAIVKFTTSVQQAGEVSACFVATAAYGTPMANEVEMLRHFRDALLETNVLGELAVETYYTFGPGVAGVVGESDLLRQTARDALTPVVTRVRGAAY